jgi:hypothetical protein
LVNTLSSKFANLRGYFHRQFRVRHGGLLRLSE